MKPLTILSLLALLGLNILNAQELSDFRWQYRILLLMDPEGSPKCTQQLRSMQEHTREMQKRDLLLFIYDGKSLLDERKKRTPLGVKGVPSPTFEGVILIEKDGGVKLRKPFPVAPAYIFERIDALPMREALIPHRP